MKKEQVMPNFIKMEEDILNFWQENKCFEKVVEKNKNSNKYYRFLDGPITANNKMGVHHAWNRSLKDMLLRFKALNGYDSYYQNGFDAQGLWVEVETEKDLGLKTKKDIEEMGLENFTKACMDRVNKFAGIITEQSKRLGQWMDWDNSYFTNSDTNITSIWYFLKLCYEKGWLELKYRPMPWCSDCGTSLSEHELADSYKDMEHTAVFLKLPIKNSNNSMIVWTTTPWTLSSNVALAVNPELEYSICKVKSTNRNLIVCSSALKVLKDDIISVEKTVLGKDLVGLEYDTCFPELPVQNFTHKIVSWNDVDATEGSGVVHIAPGCGAEDFELGNKLGLEVICPVDENGKFYDNFGFLTNKDVNEVADLVFDKLKEYDKLYYTHKYTHRYPVCWRCKKPLIFRLGKEWYIKVDEVRPQLLEAIEKVEWQPAFLKKRMADWLNNMGDWCISRKRYYGLPLPFYPCSKCGKLTVVGSLDELKQLSSKEQVEKIPHLHRPFIDDIDITCPHCGNKVHRIAEVGDCWLDAGITPFSTKKYFTDRKFWEKNFPAEVVIEMKEQVRLWFYSLLFMSVVLTGRPPYDKVIGFAMLVAEDGTKFSKSGKNNISFFDAADKIGSDVIRYMYASNNMMNDTRFGYDICDDLRRKILNLWNAYIFYNTYAVIDNPELDSYIPNQKQFDITDKWLIETTNTFINNAQTHYNKQEIFLVVKEFEEYTDNLSNWYIRVNRKRFWKSDDEEDKKVAYWCLYQAIKNTMLVMSPIIPFLTEYMWQNLVRPTEKNATESIFLGNFPQAMFAVSYPEVIYQTEQARDIITIAQRLRNQTQIKVKQPLKTMFLCVSEEVQKSVINLCDIIKDELNIKEIVFEKDSGKFNDSYLQVNFKNAGIVLKGDVQKLKQTLEKLSEKDMQNAVQEYKEGKVNLHDFDILDSSLFNLAQKPKPDFIISTENNKTIALDITLDEKLLLEGQYRELTRQVQLLRKEANFKIEDRIFAEFITDSDSINKVLNIYGEKLKSEALIKEICKLQECEFEKEIDINDEIVSVKMKR